MAVNHTLKFTSTSPRWIYCLAPSWKELFWGKLHIILREIKPILQAEPEAREYCSPYRSKKSRHTAIETCTIWFLKACYCLFSDNLFFKDLRIYLIYTLKLILVFSKDDTVAPDPTPGPVFHERFAEGLTAKLSTSTSFCNTNSSYWRIKCAAQGSSIMHLGHWVCL